MKTLTRLCLSYVCAVCCTVAPVSARSQDAPALMVLASAHFASPGRDAVNLQVEDVLSELRQQEIAAVVQQLAAFQPTRIAIEFPGAQQAALDKRYQDYRDGNYDLSRDEGEQLGMRLAAALGHERVYAVDWNGNPPGDVEADYDWYAYGQANGHEAKIAAITSPENARRFMVELKEQTIGQWLLQLNADSALQASHKVYFDIASIGDGDKLIGANWVGTWYARNLKIYSRLVHLAATPDERVLVIYGQGHAYLLRQFAREQQHFELVDVATVLTE